MDGETQNMKVIFPVPDNESLKILVSLEFLKGMCVLFLSIRADIQCPSVDRLPLIDVSSYI